VFGYEQQRDAPPCEIVFVTGPGGSTRRPRKQQTDRVNAHWRNAKAAGESNNGCGFSEGSRQEGAKQCDKGIVGRLIRIERLPPVNGEALSHVETFHAAKYRNLQRSEE